MRREAAEVFWFRKEDNSKRRGQEESSRSKLRTAAARQRKERAATEGSWEREQQQITGKGVAGGVEISKGAK